MTGPQQPATISSSCPSCGAGMEVDHDGGVLRCPYCKHEVLMPSSQTPGPATPFGQADSPFVAAATFAANYRPPAASGKAALAFVIPVILVFAVMTILVSSTIFGLFDSSDSSDSDESDKPVVVAIGAPARRDSFEVTISSVNCDKNSFSPPDDTTTEYTDESTNVIEAKGKFCVVNMSVKNVGTKTDSYSSYTPSATSPTERDLDRSWGAETLLNKGKDLLAEPIDPGKVVDRIFVFDVPTDTTMAYVMVFYGGYKIPEVKVKTS